MGEKRFRKVYVLKLKDKTFYVGHTSRDIDKVFNYHLRGDFSLTRNNPPIKILEVHDIGLTSHYEGNIYVTNKVIEYMLENGIENVRGGHLTIADKKHHIEGVALVSINDSYVNREGLRQLVEVYSDVYPLVKNIYTREDRYQQQMKKD
ncbi:hypothetical protein ACYSNR_11545 [Enterococcus sp. LJL128]|uniref:hypothetical protein n=1 Tax=Enterococcus sp. LJL51 TaxID=3416656 RepID=UPI003CF88B6A